MEIFTVNCQQEMRNIRPMPHMNWEILGEKCHNKIRHVMRQLHDV